MSWHKIATKLETEHTRLSLEAGPQVSGRELLLLQAETKTKVNAAVRLFCANEKWPDLSNRELTALCHRLQFACGFLKLLHGAAPETQTCPVPQPKYSMQPMVEWLLIDAWETYELPKHGTESGKPFWNGSGS